MRRILFSRRFRSIACSFGQSKLLEHGRRNVIYKLEFSEAISTSVGDGSFMYGGEPITRTKQMQIVKALYRGARSRASNLLVDLSRGNCFLRADDFVHILKYCATSPDPLFAMETWRLMEEKEIDLNQRCYLLMMQALCKGGYLEEASKLMKFLGESRGIYPILPAYNIFLGACAKIHSIMHANQCLDLMESQLVGKNEVTYSELLKFAVLQQNLSAAHEIWKEYIKHYSLSIISLRKFVWSFTRLGDLKSAYEALQHMVALAITGSINTYISSKGRFCSSRLDIPILSKRELGLKQYRPEGTEHPVPSIYSNKMDTQACNIEQQNIFSTEKRESNSVGIGEVLPVRKVLRWSFSDVIHGCARTQNCGLAEQLMLQMENLGLQPSSHTYDGLVRAVVSERGFRDGMEVLKIMKQRNLKPRDSTLATLSLDCSKGLELDLAEALLDQISKCHHPRVFNTFLAACDTMDQPERAVRILAKMRHLKLHPDIRTYELLFSLFGNVNAPYEEGNILSQVDAAKRISAIEMDMAKAGVQHSHLSMKNLLKALGAEGMIRELLQYLHVAENLFSHSNTFLGTPIYNTVLHSLVAAKESHMAAELFKNMRSCGSLPDAATYDIMIDCCSIIKCFKSASMLVSMMIRDGYSLQAVTYTTLIKVLIEDGDFAEAFNLFDQVCSEGIQLDVLLFNTLLSKASQKGRIDIIEVVVGEMIREKIQPDPSTCHYVFSAYVDSGFYNTAIEALQVLSMHMICEEDSTLQEKKIEFENDFIYSEDLDTESRILQFFKDSEVNLAAALLNLRWCAMVGFSISWSPSQSLWVRRLLTSYDTKRKVA